VTLEAGRIRLGPNEILATIGAGYFFGCGWKPGSLVGGTMSLSLYALTCGQ